MQRRILLLFWSIVLLVAACTRGETTATPPDIHYGEDLCAECNMIISEPRYAAGYAYEVGAGRYESLAFDDIGDLLAHMAKHPEHKIVAWYVHDYDSEAWIDATTAYYVVSTQLASPMGHGISAHATQAAAEQLSQAKAGVVYDWQGLVAQEKKAMHTAHE